MDKSLKLIIMIALLVSVVGASSFITNAAWAMAEETITRGNSRTAPLGLGEDREVALGVTPTPTNTPDLPTDTPTPTNTPDLPTDTPMPTDTPVPPTDTPSSPTRTPKSPSPPSPTPTPIPLLPEAGNPVGSEWVGWAAPALVAVFFLVLSVAVRKASS